MIEGRGRTRTFLGGSLVAALVGQFLLTGFPTSFRGSGTGVLPGASFLVLSILLAVAAGRTAVELKADEWRTAQSLWRRAGVVAGLAAAALYAIAGESLAVRVLWPAGAVLFVLSFRAEKGPEDAAWPRGAAILDGAILLALAGAGFVLRYVRLTEWPSELDADFASAGLQVTALTGDPRCIGVGDSNLPIVFYQGLKLSASLFGLDMHGLMMSSALLGTLCIGAVYLLGVEVGGRRVGLFAAAFLAMGYTAIHFSRVILTPSALLCVTLMTFFLLRALRRRGRLWFALAGVAGGASCLVYFGGRVAPLIAFALLLLDVVAARGTRRSSLRGWITMAGAALLTVGPMLVFYAGRPAALVARGADVTIFSARNRAHLLGAYHVETTARMLVEQVKRTFLTFHLFGDSSSEFGFRGPMVDVLTAAFLLVGLGLALRRVRSRSTLAFVTWIGGVLVVGGMLTLDPPDWVHLVAALPAVTVLAAVGVDACIRSFAGNSRSRRAALTVLAAVLVAAFAVQGWNVYVNAVRDNAGLFCSVARYVDGLPSDTRVLIVRDPLSWADRTLRFFDRGVDGRDVSRDEARDLEREDKRIVLVMTPEHAAMLLSPLQRRFPEAPAFAHYNHGWLHFYSLHVAPAEPRSGPAAAPYRSLGRTSPLGWSFGLLAAALAAAAPWLARGPDASRAGGSAPAEREPPPPVRVIDEAVPAPAVAPARPGVEPADVPADAPAPPPRLVGATAVSLADTDVRHPALLVVGFLLAVVAQVLFDAQRPEGIAVWKALLAPIPESTRVAWGSALLLAAVALWVGALRPVRPLHAPGAPLVWPRSLTLLLLPAVGCAAFALVRFGRTQEDGAVRAAWVASIVLFLAGPAIVAWRARHVPEEAARSRRLDPRVLLALAVILIAAAYFRFPSLGFLPDDFHGDTSSYGHTAREYLSGEESRLFGVAWADIPRMGYQPTVLGMRLGGNDVRGLMTAAAVGGLLSLVALFGLVRILFDSDGLALLATAVSAGNAAHIHFSRIAQYMDPWPFCLGALFFLVAGLRGRRLVSFAMAGVLLGFGLQMYYSGRVTAVVCAAFFVWTLFFRRDWARGSAAGWALLGTGVLVTAGPNVVYFLKDFQALNARGRQVWLFSPDVLTHLSGIYHVSSPVLILLRQIVRSLLLFNHTIDTSTQFGYTHAMISPLIAPFVVLGFAVALRRWREPGPALALSFWALTLALGGFLTVDAPFWPRLVGILAPASIFAGLALQTLAAFFASRVPRLGLAIPAAAAVLLLWAAVSSYAVYRHDMSDNARTHAFIGRYLGSLPRDVTACATESPFEIGIRELAFLAWPRRTVEVKEANAGAPPQACTTPPFTWILGPNDVSMSARLKERWPDGVLEPHRKRGDLVFESFTVLGSPAAVKGH